jgi:hypothetical protein
MRIRTTVERVTRRTGRAPWIIAAIVAAGVIAALIMSRAAILSRGSYRAVGTILVSADGRTLAGSVGSECGSAELKVKETRTSVTVRLRTYSGMMLAPGSCAILSFTATLRAPLGKRRLVDGVVHKAVPAFDGRTIKRPTSLPAGFVHRYDTATFEEEEVMGRTAGCVQIFTKDDSWEEGIWVTQDRDARWKAPEGVTEQPITVRGHPGTAIPGEIQWIEDRQLFTVQSRAYAYAVLTTEQLLAIAESLR